MRFKVEGGDVMRQRCQAQLKGALFLCVAYFNLSEITDCR